MVEAELLSGEGWISDESSFYGDDDEQDRLHSHCERFNPKYFWSAQKSDLNVALAPYKAQSQYSVKMTEFSEFSTANATLSSSAFPIDRRAMEEARLARLGKRKREPPPEAVLFNPGQGSPDAWQLGESAEDFVRRLPPLTTSINTCAWIWAHNPHFDVRDKNKVISHRADDFRSLGTQLLGESLQARQQIQSHNLHGPKAAITRSLNQESKDLQQRITDLAVECGVLSGKWMLFPKLEEVNQVWKKVVEGVINNRLGPTAKVAPDEGKPGDRLICIYTRDFRDQDDVLRVLLELETMGLVNSGRSIYYKSDAFTYLDLYKQTASEYGLQASLYTSFKMMAAAKAAKAESLPGKTVSGKTLSGKKQSTLNKYF
ncbi:hypothetical protein HBI56_068580 [Parastagonospora nodorum]|uniref:DUF1917 domain-containing protein n=1 Tax=Phaeosphaeria nodorum (strain SN15 / ATCC MYA-4574 / FGSC 10173) TaxID=321614 RepID=A0A7U2HVJ4_PHANO|nr:hypothetical protein HBH56_003020 [Parastagonospora nodorum]QRC90241.1 hypothetical protein JI435_096460 [Parastagonospora nodorum SN15]KAH3937743.1 hypothetical protein HBH54_003020 [Parastagonospora nodorum]KAH3946609.1 hypothetical protein HBH53_128980 [Parastagonospora nodorum]KAH3975081.1 hypothetical protein HBH51_085790 [Parastagonospora nodorum]